MLRLIDKRRHSDVITGLEDSIFPKHFYKKVLPWQQQGIHTQTFTFKQIPIHFLVELYFSLPELWAKILNGGAKHPPGQDRVKNEPYIPQLLLESSHPLSRFHLMIIIHVFES